MGVQITIRDVPEDVRDELAARAAKRRQSMQEYLRSELERLAARPSIDEWLSGIRERKSIAGSKIETEDIVDLLDRDRR